MRHWIAFAATLLPSATRTKSDVTLQCSKNVTADALLAKTCDCAKLAHSRLRNLDLAGD